jgi:hypothetical protein
MRNGGLSQEGLIMNKLPSKRFNRTAVGLNYYNSIK